MWACCSNSLLGTCLHSTICVTMQVGVCEHEGEHVFACVCTQVSASVQV